MNSIKSLLGGATAGLSAQKSMMNLIGKNIANANTPGYSRQRGVLKAGHGGQAVSLSDVQAVRSSAIHRSILGASQAMGFEAGRIEGLSIAEPALNDLDGAGVSQAMNDFFLAMSELSGEPGGVAERQNLLAKTRSMATSLNTAALGLQEAQSTAESESKLTVTSINQLTAQIADLNISVTSAAANGQPNGEFVDQRDQLLAQLAGEIDIQTVEQPDGAVLVHLSNGVQMVGRDGPSSVAVTGGGPEALGLTVTKPTGTTVNVGSAPGGRMGGLFSARDVTLQSSLDQLDQMAFDLATEMNQLHQTGFGTDGSTGLKMFDVPATAKGAASNIKLSTDIDGQPEKIAASADAAMVPGDDTNLKAMLNLQETAFVTGGKTLAQAYDGAVFTVSVALNNAHSQFSAAASRADTLESMRASESGVSLEEEMVNLTQAERAFQAATRIVETANTLYDTLFQMV
ncbi:MAG: flagellar hook-associated protein 1 FlgK [Myxococcota bacterium]|jgi:flagellar hook-associated protein 1 FlgK